MKVPRIRIASVMFGVAIVALDLGVIRACFDSPSRWSDYLLPGALPMANVLAVGLLIGHQRPRSSPFLLGFETFGAAALALYVALTICLIDNWGMSTPYEVMLWSYLSPVLDRTDAVVGREQVFLATLVSCFVGAVMLGWPQLAFALLGGFLARRYRVTITRR